MKCLFVAFHPIVLNEVYYNTIANTFGYPTFDSKTIEFNLDY